MHEGVLSLLFVKGILNQHAMKSLDDHTKLSCKSSYHN